MKDVRPEDSQRLKPLQLKRADDRKHCVELGARVREASIQSYARHLARRRWSRILGKVAASSGTDALSGSDRTGKFLQRQTGPASSADR